MKTKALIIGLALACGMLSVQAQETSATTEAIAKAAVAAQEAPKEAVQNEQGEYQLSWNSLHMGTIISAQVFGKTPAEAKRLKDVVESEIVHYDDTMSVHKKTVLNDVNARSGQWVEVPYDIALMTEEALAVAKHSDSAFEPTIGTVVNVWRIGFGGNQVPSDAAIKAALAKVDYRKVQVKEEKGRWYVRIAPGQFLDMGGIAKGFIGTRIQERLKKEGAKHAMIDLGGNVVAVGEKSPGHPWRVGLQRPDRERNQIFAVVEANDVSVITSGAYERFIEKNGKHYGHILSATTGRPVLTDISSVSIVDANGAKADAWCTALFAMGWNKSLQYLKKHPDVHAVLMNADLKTVAISEALKDSIKVTEPGLKVEYY